MSNVPNRILAGIVAAIVLAAIVVTIVVATRAPQQVEAGTPAATVQGYLEALMDGDHERAAGYFDPASGCTAAMLDSQGEVDPRSRIELVSENTNESSARVIVRVFTGSGSDPLSDGYSEQVTFRLSRLIDGWALSGTPWPMWSCDKADG